MTEFKNNLIQKIQDGELDMKPRWHFVLKTALAVFGVLLAGLVAIYLLSLVVFVMKANGLIFSVLYGFRGVSLFVLGSPWLLIGATGLFGLTLYVLVTHFSFSYKRPLIYSLFGAVIAVLLGAFLLGQTTVHDRLRQHGVDSGRPILQSLYGRADEQPRGAMVGVIQSVTDTGFVIETKLGGVVEVVVTNDTRVRQGQTFVAGESVLVFGEEVGSTIEAIGVRAVPERGGFGRPDERASGTPPRR